MFRVSLLMLVLDLMVISAFAVRHSRANDLRFENANIKGGGIGIRIESHPSRPYEEGRWVKNLVVQNCTFEGCLSHEIEIYGMEGICMEDITPKNGGECGS